jgi:hypothetical protein
MNKNFTVGTIVIVPSPNPNDSWNHSFEGTIKQIKNDTDETPYVTIEDQDGDCWDVNFDRLEILQYD